MEHSLSIIYFVFAGAAILTAVLGCVQTWEHRRFARSRIKRLGDHRPRGKAMIFAPCKGVDLQLRRNLERLFQQDYEEYEITFIVQSRSDACCKLIEQAMAENPHIRSRLVVAGQADVGGQKVHNLRFATGDIPADIDFLVFVDSDAQPRREWLRALIGRLGTRQRAAMGASTGYRWLVPTRSTWTNHILYSINCSVTTLLGSRGCYPVWGGSWAIRRETFQAVDLQAQWAGTLSDDLVAGQLLKSQGRPVKYEPACLVSSPVDSSFRDTFSFLRRQYLIARFYVPLWWLLGLVTVSVSTLIWPASLLAIGFALFVNSPWVWLPVSILAIVYGLGVYRGWLRQSLVKLHFPQLEEKLRPASRFDVWAGPIAAVAHWLVFIAAAFGKTITWRGITYRLHRGGQAEIVRRAASMRLKAFGEFAADSEQHGDEIEPLCAAEKPAKQKAA